MSIGIDVYHQGSWRRPETTLCDLRIWIPFLGPRWQSLLWVTSVKLSVSLELISFSVILRSRSSVKGKPFENAMRQHIARANWGARPGFGSVWSDFV